MSPMIDLGLNDEITFEIGTEIAKMPLVDPATYEFSIAQIEPTNTAEGRPRWVGYLKIMNDPTVKNNGRSLRYSMPLPWINPTTGQVDVGGLGFLVNLCQGVGTQWIGNLRDEAVQENLRLSLQGKAGFMRVGQRSNPRNLDEFGKPRMENTVRIVVSRRR